MKLLLVMLLFVISCTETNQKLSSNNQVELLQQGNLPYQAYIVALFDFHQVYNLQKEKRETQTSSDACA